jgi:FixJ family two-component response regulator
LTVPVIVMTADISSQVVLQCFHAGADDFIGKPFDEVYLAAIVERTLDRSSLSLKYAKHKDGCEEIGKYECSCGLKEAVWEATEATRSLKPPQ